MIKISLKELLKSSITWAIHLVKFISFGNNRRFCVISPPFFNTQLIFDKKLNKTFTVKIRNIIDWCTITQIFYDNDYGFEKLARSQEIEDYYKKILATGDSPLIVDCGANIGLATKFFSKTYSESNIICIEPDRENIRQARTNNLEKNIIFLEAAVGNIDMRGRIVDPGLGNWGYRIESDEVGGVEILSINSLINELQTKKLKPFIIKIDIEGFESQLFSSNTEWVKEFPVLIIELHDGMFPNTANSNNFLKEISKLNRDFLFHGENIFSISNSISLSTE